MTAKDILEMIIKEYERKVYITKHVFKKAKKAKRIKRNQMSSCFCMYYLALRDDFENHRKFLWKLKYLKMFLRS